MKPTNKAAVLLNLPPDSLAGIDLISFTTTPSFKGIKLLPPGWHFLFASSSNLHSERHGAWFEISSSDPRDLVAFAWDEREESVVRIVDEATLMQFRANLGQVWSDGLSPYRLSSGREEESENEEKVRDWRLLTDCITPELLNRVLGSGVEKWTLTTASSAKVDDDDIPNLSKATATGSIERSETELHLLPIDLKRTWRAGATGRERTDAARDHSWYLFALIQEHCFERNENELVGELQFSFLMALVLSNYSCAEQWKRILGLVFTSFDAVEERSSLYVRIIRTLALQMRHVNDAEGGTGMFDLGETDGKFLKDVLRKFKQGLISREEGFGRQDVLEELEELEGFLKSEFGWEIDQGYIMRHRVVQLEDGELVEVDMDTAERDEQDEEGEYAPTVVELTDEQLRGLSSAGNGVAEPEEQIREELEEDKMLEDMED